MYTPSSSFFFFLTNPSSFFYKRYFGQQKLMYLILILNQIHQLLLTQKSLINRTVGSTTFQKLINYHKKCQDNHMIIPSFQLFSLVWYEYYIFKKLECK